MAKYSPELLSSMAIQFMAAHEALDPRSMQVILILGIRTGMAHDVIVQRIKELI